MTTHLDCVRATGWDARTIVNARVIVRLLDAGVPVGVDDEDVELVRDIAALADEHELYPTTRIN